MKIRVLALALTAALPFLFNHCSDKEEEPTTSESVVESQLVSNSGWSSYAHDGTIFFNQSARSGYYQYEYILGDVNNGTPTFIVWKTIYALGQANPTVKNMSWNLVSDGGVQEVEGWRIGIYDRRLHPRDGGGSLPENLIHHDKDGISYSPTYQPFFYGNEPFAGRTYFSKVSSQLNGSWRTTSFVGTSNNSDIIGWMGHQAIARYRSEMPGLKGYFNPQYGQQTMTNINGKEIVVCLASDIAQHDASPESGVYVFLVGKDFNNIISDTTEHHSNPLRLADGETQAVNMKTACIGDVSLSIAGSTSQTHVILGSFQDGIREVHSFAGNGLNAQVLAGKNAFFVFDGVGNAFKVETNGTVTTLPEAPENPLDLAVFNGELIAAFATQENAIKVVKCTANGLEPLGSSTITKPLNHDGQNFHGGASLAFATDGDLLFAAIKNNSPKYKAAEQWTSWEIVKFNN